MIAVVGCGVMAGLFFVFSVSVMNALAQMPADQGMRAMQLINRTILNPVFLSAFFGTGLACLSVAVTSVWQQQSGFAWSLTGAILYLLGGFGVTAAFNVPLNNALDAVPLESPEAKEEWSKYLARWTHWNHFRTVVSIAAAALLVIGLL